MIEYCIALKHRHVSNFKYYFTSDVTKSVYELIKWDMNEFHVGFQSFHNPQSHINLGPELEQRIFGRNFVVKNNI